MKKEITIGQALSILVVMVIGIIGWGVSVEVRITTLETKFAAIAKMNEKVDSTHDAVIRIEEWIKNNDK